MSLLQRHHGVVYWAVMKERIWFSSRGEELCGVVFWFLRGVQQNRNGKESCIRFGRRCEFECLVLVLVLSLCYLVKCMNEMMVLC